MANWIDQLPEEVADSISDELKNDPTLADCATIESLAKRFVDTKAMVGRSVRIPGEDAGPEAQKEFLEQLINRADGLMYKPDFSEPEQSNEFYRTLGKPEKSEDYKLPEGTNLPEDAVSEFREMAFAANMTGQQFESWINGMNNSVAKQTEVNKGLVDEAWGKLKQDWGMTFDGRLEAAKKMNDEFYPGRDFGSLRPSEVKALFQISESVTGVSSPVASQDDGAPQPITPAEARMQADEIMRRVHDPNSDLTREDKLRLINKRMKLLVDYAGYDGSIDSLRVG